MLKYILKRILQLIPVLLVASILIFSVVRISPTDPIASITKGKQVSESTIQQLRTEYNLDKSYPEQYLIWIGGMLHGDFGVSFQHRESVVPLIAERAANTIQLVVMSSVLILVIAIPMGVFCAMRKNSAWDQGLSIFSLILVSSPSFLTGIILLMLFSLIIPIFPTFGTGNGIWDNFRYLTLPAISLAAGSIALTARITRSNMIEQLSSGYVQTAQAKGLSTGAVVFKHALKNAVIPILTIASIQICGMLAGTVLVENVFAINGIGTLLVEGINKADYPIVQAITLILVTMYLLTNLLVDIVYGVVDPRIRLK